MAGRAAYERSDYSEATKYFSALITSLDKETNSAAAQITAEAWFALGDTMFQNFLANTNRTADDFREIITALTRITKDYETNAIAPRAWGQMGNYYFQWAGLNSAEAETQYKRALECYGSVIVSKVADISARSEADVGVGIVCEKEAEVLAGKDRQLWLDAALQHYMNVVMQSNVRDGETFDPKWVYEAGIRAAKICENSGQWEQAKEAYTRLAKLLPALQTSIEKKIAAAQAHLETAKN
jgi:tetratricopeptide (TPR) repeat protein